MPKVMERNHQTLITPLFFQEFQLIAYIFVTDVKLYVMSLTVKIIIFIFQAYFLSWVCGY